MSSSSDDAKACADLAQTEALLRAAGVVNKENLIMASTIGCFFQALATGICCQLVYQYFHQPRRDSVRGRVGIMLLFGVVLLEMATCDYHIAILIRRQSVLTSIVYIDYWLVVFEILMSYLVRVPVLVFFARRAYIIWDRSRYVLALCSLSIAVHATTGVASSITSLIAPWGLHVMTNEEFAANLHAYLARRNQLFPVKATSLTLQLVTTLLLCILICYGVFRHRSGTQEVDRSISKIVFLCGESLLPLVGLSVCYLVGLCLRGQKGNIITRISAQLSACVYFGSLLSSLVHREDVARILHEQPVRGQEALEEKLRQDLAADAAAAASAMATGGGDLVVPTLNTGGHVAWPQISSSNAARYRGGWTPSKTSLPLDTKASPPLSPGLDSRRPSIFADLERLHADPPSQTASLSYKLGAGKAAAERLPHWATTGDSLEAEVVDADKLRRGSDLLAMEEALSRGPRNC